MKQLRPHKHAAYISVIVQEMKGRVKTPSNANSVSGFFFFFIKAHASYML